MSKPIASSARFITTLAAAVVGATALSLATPLPAAADDRGRWEQNDKKGKHENHDRRQGQGNSRGNSRGGWNGGHDRGGNHDRGNGNRNQWNGGGNHGGGKWNGNDRHHWGGHDYQHHGGSNHYRYYGPPKVKHHHHYYSQRVYIPQPIYVSPGYAYAPSYFCTPCAHYFATYDDLYAHAAYAHYVPDYDLPNLVVQVGVNWVFGF
jgi:hypothetical protein